MILRFQVSEAERKMRDAISRLDFEAAIPLRDTWKRLITDLARAEADAAREILERKVIDFQSRSPVASEPEAIPVTLEDDVADEIKGEADDIALMKYLLEEAEAGRMKGFLVFAGIPEEDGEVATVTHWDTSSVWPAYQQFIGGMEELKHDLLASTADDDED